MKKLWDKVLRDTTVDKRSVHGPLHWAVVERNGHYLAQFEEIDINIIDHFAVLHDCQRLNDNRDDGHGYRAMQYAQKIRDRIVLQDSDFKRLCTALRYHTGSIEVDDLTIMACWDSDRLDLGRVDIRPDPLHLHTKTAKEIAKKHLYKKLEHIEIRSFNPY